MALIKCPSCSNDVSPQAAACPKCGHPIASAKPVPPPKKSSGCGTLLAIVIGVPVVFAIWAGGEADKRRQEQAAVESARVAKLTPEQRATEQKAAAAAREAQEFKDIARASLEVAKRKVPLSLKDPASAKFRDLIAVKTPAGGLLVCGHVNSKNSFGGYSGFKMFMFNSSVTVLEEQMDPGEFAKVWNEMCANKPPVASSD